MIDVGLDKIGADEEEFFYNVMMGQAFNVPSPFEIRKDIDFPKKDELGGVVLKFIGSGAAYFKIQTEMPTEEEVRSIFEVGQFLYESFGGYVVLKIVCTPDIEIRNIQPLSDDHFDTDFLSIRKLDGIEVLELLIGKLENNEDFTIDDHILRIFLPFTGRKSEEEFECKYSRFLDLYAESGLETPQVGSLSKSNISFVRWFSDERGFDFSLFRNSHLSFQFREE